MAPTGTGLLTVRQVAERLGVSPALVYGLCAARKIRHERHGLGRGAIRIPEAALDEYRRGRTIDVRSEAAPEQNRPKARPVRLKHLRLPS